MPGGRGRGGKRVGKVGTAYGNRTDMNGPQPISAAPGQAYGERKAQEDAQRAVPMGNPGPPAIDPAALAQVPKAGTMPGLWDDSTNPGEDVMSGARLGPGPGPEAFGFGEPAQTARDMDFAGRYLPAMEASANGPKGSPQARQIVRLLRAHMNLEG